MRLVKEILKRGMQGAIIGVFLIMTIGIISILFSCTTESIAIDFFIKQYIAGAVLGFVFGTLNLLFVYGKLGLTLTTIIHFIGESIVFYPMAYYAGWISKDAMTVAGITVQMVIIYFIIWIICYIGWKRDLERINKSLRKKLGSCK